MLEAMSCGAAVVATRIPTFVELIEDCVNGRLVPIGVPPLIADAVRVAYSRRAELGAAARLTVERSHSADHLYARLSALLESAVVRHRPASGATVMARE